MTKPKILMEMEKIPGIESSVQDINSSLNERTYYLTPQMYGAKGDGVADDTIAIQNAINDATTQNKTVLMDGISFKTTDTINVTCQLIMNVPILYRGTKDRPALLVTKSGNHKLSVKGIALQDSSMWANSNYIGIILKGISFSNIEVESYSFYTGVQLLAENNTYCAYNKIYIKGLYDCKVSMHLFANKKDGVNYTDGGWMNENSFYGGDFHSTSNVSSFADKDTIGILMESNTSHWLNGNTFFRPCLQIIGTPVYIKNATDCSIEGCRGEASTKDYGFARIDSGCNNNVITVLYGTTLTYTDNGLANVIAFLSALAFKSKMYELFTYNFASGHTFHHKNQDTSLGAINPFIDIGSATSGNLPVYSTDKSIPLTDSSYNYGIWLEVANLETLQIIAKADGNFRLYFATYDANYAGVAPTAGSIVSDKSIYISGNGYSMSADSVNIENVKLIINSTTIKFIRVAITKGTGTANALKLLKILTDNSINTRAFKRDVFGLDAETANVGWSVTNLPLGSYIPNKNPVQKSDAKGSYYIKGWMITAISGTNQPTMQVDKLYI